MTDKNRDSGLSESETLRTRIAAAIREVDDMRVCKLSDADIKFVADAVIRELGLTRFDAPPEYWYATTIWTTTDE